ncbi:MAG: hypothetical protein ACXVPU_00905 [Bacteroidia bacterium]
MKKTFRLAILLLIYSCRSSPTQYHANGIDLTLPSDWRITSDDTDPLPVMIGKRSIFSTGSISIDVSNTDHGPKWQIEEYENIFENMPSILRYHFDTIETTRVNNIKALKANFRQNIKRVPLIGTIYSFNGCNKIITIIVTEMKKDSAKNYEGIKTILNSITCYPL